MSEEEPQHRVVVGLGNPGERYALTRHNMGYLVVNALAQVLGWKFKEERLLKVRVAKGKLDQLTVHLVLPLTYMNESGWAVRHYLDLYKLAPRNLRVVCDDIALAFGELRVRSMGSAGGHNGLKSLQTHLATQHYVRLRMGIGENPVHQELADYVLEGFTPEELQQLPSFIERGVQIIGRLISEEVSVVMNSVNAKSKSNLKNGSEKGQESTR